MNNDNVCAACGASSHTQYNGVCTMCRRRRDVCGLCVLCAACAASHVTARRRVYHDAVCTACGCDTWAPRVRCATCNTRTMVCAACERCDDCARDVVTCAQCDDASCDVRAHDDDDAMCDDCGTIGTAHDVDGATCYVCDDCGASWLYVQRATPRDVVTAQRDDDVPTCGDAACGLWRTCAVYSALRALPRAHIYDADVCGICAVNDADNDDAELRAWAHATRCDVCDNDADVCATCVGRVASS